MMRAVSIAAVGTLIPAMLLYSSQHGRLARAGAHPGSRSKFPSRARGLRTWHRRSSAQFNQSLPPFKRRAGFPSPCLFFSVEAGAVAQDSLGEPQRLLCLRQRTVPVPAKGNCYDNAAVETFFKTNQAELIWRKSWATRRQAEMAIFL